MALYTFRRSARAGELINLLLERVFDRFNFKTLRHSNDVETQIDTPQDSHSIDSSCTNNEETPPDWFKTAIEQLKVELKNELVTEMYSIACDVMKSPKLETIEVIDSDLDSSSKEEVKEEELRMDARPISLQTSYPHMLGGEIYLHQWEVQNTGQVTWDSAVCHLRLAGD